MIPVVASARVTQALLALLRTRLKKTGQEVPGDLHSCYWCLPQSGFAVLYAQAGYYSWSCPVCSVNYVVTNSEIDRWEREQDARLAAELKRALDRCGGPRRLLELELEGGERVVVAPVDDSLGMRQLEPASSISPRDLARATLELTSTRGCGDERGRR